MLHLNQASEAGSTAMLEKLHARSVGANKFGSDGSFDGADDKPQGFESSRSFDSSALLTVMSTSVSTTPSMTLSSRR